MRSLGRTKSGNSSNPREEEGLPENRRGNEGRSNSGIGGGLSRLRGKRKGDLPGGESACVVRIGGENWRREGLVEIPLQRTMSVKGKRPEEGAVGIRRARARTTENGIGTRGKKRPKMPWPKILNRDQGSRYR